MRGDREIRDLLEGWCAQPSGSRDAEGLRRMAGLLAAAFRGLPGEVREVPLAGALAPAVVATCRPEAPDRVLLAGHYDTVFGPDDPFRAVDEVAPGVLRGPGVADMKGGLLVMLLALEAFEAGRPDGRLGWSAVLTPDEEIGSAHGGPLLVALAGEHHAGLVFEPAQPGGALVRHRAGTGAFTFRVTGRSAHPGRDPGEGRNALAAMSALAVALEDLARDRPALRITATAAEGGGAANVVPASARLTVDVRAWPPETGDDVLEALRRVAARVASERDVRIAVEGRMHRPPMRAGAAADRLFAAYREVARGLGVDVSRVDSGGGSDGSLLAAAGLPVLDALGVRGSGLHGPEERCELESVPERATLCAGLLAEIAAGKVLP